MKISLLFTLIVCFAINLAKAQSLSPTVVSTSGAFYANGTGMLSSTIGELAMVETFATGGSILNQGFQQAFDFTTGIYNPTVRNDMNVFPNPTSGNITVQVPSSFTGEVYANVYDVIGQLVLRKTEKLNGQLNSLVFSLGDLTDGMYLFEIRTKSESFVTKINLVK